MKAVAIILVSFLWCAKSIQEHELLEEWKAFQVNYGKSYRSPLEARKRLGIFHDNLEEIHTHNELFRKGETTFRKGINQFTDWTQDEFMQFIGQGLSEESGSNNRKVFKKIEGFKIPESVDWREKKAVSPVKDQVVCGGCWAFSAIGSIESQLLIVKNDSTSLSEQNIIDCDKADRGCKGGWPYRGLEYVEKDGVESAEDYVFIGRTDRCRKNYSKPVHKISSYENIPEGDEQALQEVVATKGPVSICLYTSSNFKAYESGILIEKDCPKDQFTHAVLVVGYGSENGQDYYIVKNSWGAKWGESGYIRLARNNDNMCGLASRAVIPIL